MSSPIRRLLLAAGLLVASCTTTGEPLAGPATGAIEVPPVTPSESTGTPPVPVDGFLRFGLGDDPRSIDPRLADDDAGLLVVDALFDSLTTHGRNFFPVPSVASSWLVSEDQLTWTFEIDVQARFHDGRRVRAEDFVRSFNRIASGTVVPRSFQAHLLADVQGWGESQLEGVPLAGVVAVDELTLEIRLVRPVADLASVLAHPSLAPVPPAADDDPAWTQSPIGNGPFKMVEPWAHNQFIRLSRARDDVPLQEVLFRIYAGDPGHAQQYLDFTSGQLHVAQVPASEFAEALATFGSAGDGESATGVLDGPWATTYHYGFDTSRPPFDRVEMRQAVSLVLDRAGIADEIMLSTREPATSLLPAGLVGFSPNGCTWCDYDPQRARQVLIDAGIDVATEYPEPIVLLHNDGATHGQIADRIASSIEQELGLQVEIRSQALQEHAKSIGAGEGNLFRLGWTSEHPLPSSFLVPLFHSRNLGEDNVTRFSDPEVDALLDQADASLDRRTRLALSASATERIAELLPIAPLLTYRLLRVVSDDVQGFRMDALGRVDLARVQLSEAS